MPFTSQKQRGLFYAAEEDEGVRERTGISKAVADKMTSEDKPGKLPKYAHKGHSGKLPTFAASKPLRK